MLALLFLLLMTTTALGADLPQQVRGSATVVDGDGLWVTDKTVGRKEIRLFGIDAPEVHEGQLGRTARSAMEQLVDKREVTCAVRTIDRYKRLIAVCTAEGVDLGAAMLEAGQAATYRRYLIGSELEEPYLAAERRAQAGHLGIWATQWRPAP